MSRSEGTLSARLLGRAVLLLEQRGLDPAPHLLAAGIERDLFARANGRVPYDRVDILIDSAAQSIPVAELGLALAHVQDDSYGVPGLLLLSSGTYRQGLSRCFAYQRLWGDGERFVLSEEAGGCGIRFRHPGESAVARAVLAECAFGEVMLAARLLVSSEASAEAVELSHAPLGEPAPLADFFGVAPRFCSPENVLVLGTGIVDRPLHLCRDLLSKVFEEQCRRAVRVFPRAGTSLFERARAIVQQSLDRRPTLRAIAARLHVSTRTLQRHLAEHGTSFQEVLDATRRAEAEQLIAGGVPLKDAAYRVGFNDPSALHRARRRWAGRPSP